MRVAAGWELCNLQPITASIIHNYLWFGQFLFGFLDIVYTSFFLYFQLSFLNQRKVLLNVFALFGFPVWLVSIANILLIWNIMNCKLNNCSEEESCGPLELGAVRANGTGSGCGGPGPALSSQSSDNHPVWESRVSTRVSVQRIYI